MNRFALLACALLAGLAGRSGLHADTGVDGGSRMSAQAAAETGVLFRTIDIAGETYRYAVYVPRDYDAAREWPCVVFLNGSGECGRDGQKQLGVGLLPAIMLQGDQWHCLAVFPQKPTSKTEWEDHEALVLGALDASRKEWKIDAKRIALTGLSQGGHGTWVLGSRHPELFSRIAPLCGYGDAKSIAPGAAELPVWAFHGEKDDAVKSSQSKDIVGAIKAHKPAADAKLTLYPDANHNCWDRAYRDEKLGLWLTRARD